MTGLFLNKTSVRLSYRLGSRNANRGDTEADLNYRFENWNRLRAPGWPDFLRSLILGSRVRRPSSFSVGRMVASCCSNARAMANRTAPACPAIPPPVVFTLTSNELLVLVPSNGFRTVDCSDGVAKYSSNGRPLTSILPEPRETRT